jgi:acyl-CoA synthetase (AMP-forming)/AMP-acid ligase II
MTPADTLPARLLAKAAETPDAVFAHVTSAGVERTLAFGELADRAGAFASALHSVGVRPGDVVPIALPTSADYVIAVFGCHLLGAAIAPLPPLASSKEEQTRFHAARLQSAAARCDSRVALVTGAAAELLAPSIDASALELMTVEALAASGVEAVAPAPFAPDRTAVVQFSSGSTAMPKGVRITFRNIRANAAAIAERARITPADSILSFLPLFHDFGLFCGIIYPLEWNIASWLYPTEDFIRRPSFWLKAMSRTRATMCPAPQFVYQVGLHRIRERDLEGVDLSSWRISYDGGEPVHAPSIRAFSERFARWGLSSTTIAPSYGMAEATLAIAIHPPGTPFHAERVSRDALGADRRTGDATARLATDEEPAVELVACGAPLEGIGLAILDDNGDELAERRVGEIAIRGESVAREYLLGPGETEPLVRDGWFRTGDLGYLADGLVFVTGRIKDLIIRGGRNYFPQDIERIVESLDGVRLNGVVAFGCYDDVDGSERIVVVIELDTHDAETVGTLPDRARRAVYDALEVTIDDVALKRKGWIPKTTSAKLQRSKARDFYLAERDEP